MLNKEDFQKVLWSFHNIVNKRRRVQQFSFEDCQKLYKNAKLNNILENFYIIWSKNFRVMKLMGDTFKRDRCIEHVKKWIYTNKDHFDI